MAIVKPDMKDTMTNWKAGARDWKKTDWPNFLEEFFKQPDDSSMAMEVKRDFAPALNILESDRGYHIETELPGVKRDDVKVEIKNDYLVISGEKRSFNEDKRNDYHHIERTHGTFYRSIYLPKDADKEKIAAELKEGVLSIDMAKKAPQTVDNRKVEIR